MLFNLGIVTKNCAWKYLKYLLAVSWRLQLSESPSLTENWTRQVLRLTCITDCCCANAAEPEFWRIFLFLMLLACPLLVTLSLTFSFSFVESVCLSLLCLCICIGGGVLFDRFFVFLVFSRHSKLTSIYGKTTDHVILWWIN